MPVDLEGEAAFEAALTQMLARVTAATEGAARALEPAVEGLVHPQHERSGTLRQSIIVEPDRIGEGVFMNSVGPTADYTRVTELGHKGKQNKPPHPWFLPGFQRAEPSLHEVYLSAWRRAIGG